MSLIKKPNELTVKTTLSALIYGQPGMGKTTLALSAPNPVLFDYDGGIHRVNAAHRVPTVQITSWDETNQVLASEEIKEFDTIVIDTAGKMLSFMDKAIMAANPKMKKVDGTLSLRRLFIDIKRKYFPAGIWGTKEYVYQLCKSSYPHG